MPQHPLDSVGPRTLRTIYALQRDDVLADPGAAPTTQLHEERGWLVTRRVVDVVEPYVTSLPDDDADLARYAGLDAEAAADLLTLLTPGQLDDRQNDAPALGALLRAALAHPDDVEVHGYLVGPARTDERISAEGVDLYGVPFADTSDEAVWAAALALGLDDARRPPDATTRHLNPWRPYEPCWRLWWD